MGDGGHNIDMGLKEGGRCYAPFAERWEPVYYNVACADVYFRTKWRLHPSSRFTAGFHQNSLLFKGYTKLAIIGSAPKFRPNFEILNLNP